MKIFLKGIIFVIFFLSASQSKDLKVDEKKSILFVYGGWKGHEPVKCRDLFVPWLKKQGYKVTSSPSLDSYLDEELMNTVDLIIQIYTMSSISKDQEKMLLKAVKERGVSIAGWHGGLADAFTKMPVVWKKKYGKGKVFYTSLGHTVDVFDIPEAITIMQRGILWALGDLTD